MKRFTISLALLGSIILGAVLCAAPPAADKSDKPATSPFAGRLKEIAGAYPLYDMAEGRRRWAPTRCAAPPGPPHPQFSASTDPKTHGQKLYTLYAKQRDAYLKLGKEK